MQSIAAARGGSRVGVIDQLTASGVFHVGQRVNALPAARSVQSTDSKREPRRYIAAQHREFLEICQSGRAGGLQISRKSTRFAWSLAPAYSDTGSIPSNLLRWTRHAYSDLAEYAACGFGCPQVLCMTYAQPMYELWIKTAPKTGQKDIHRIAPSLRGPFTGGFGPNIPFDFNQIRYFSTKSGPTTTT